MAQDDQNPEAEENARSLIDDLRQIARRCSKLPVLDARTPDEILGYDECGLPS